MSNWIITEGINNGYPYLDDVPLPSETVLTEPYPRWIWRIAPFYNDGYPYLIGLRPPYVIPDDKYLDGHGLAVVWDSLLNLLEEKIVDNLTSTSTTSALSANQGRLLNINKVDIDGTTPMSYLTMAQGRYCREQKLAQGNNVEDGTTTPRGPTQRLVDIVLTPRDTAQQLVVLIPTQRGVRQQLVEIIHMPRDTSQQLVENILTPRGVRQRLVEIILTPRDTIQRLVVFIHIQRGKAQ